MSRLVKKPNWVVRLVGRVIAKQNFTSWLSFALVLGGIGLLSQSVYMDAKASLAQVLIKNTWSQRDANSPPSKPWWWADTQVIAKLDVPRLDKQIYVMQDDSGESLAFGPGHLASSSDVASDGHVMIAGHRDSHFTFLENLKLGDVIETTKFDASSKRYQVKEIYIMDSEKEDLHLLDQAQLTLITCYPFDSIVPGGPLRYIVNAVAI